MSLCLLLCHARHFKSPNNPKPLVSFKTVQEFWNRAIMSGCLGARLYSAHNFGRPHENMLVAHAWAHVKVSDQKPSHGHMRVAQLFHTQMYVRGHRPPSGTHLEMPRAAPLQLAATRLQLFAQAGKTCDRSIRLPCSSRSAQHTIYSADSPSCVAEGSKVPLTGRFIPRGLAILTARCSTASTMVS
eukprot:356120-Chlamydomonas_euryale.AAC.6